jgi:hypothetical protein
MLEDHGGSILYPRDGSFGTKLRGIQVGCQRSNAKKGEGLPSSSAPSARIVYLTVSPTDSFQHADHPRPVESNKLRLAIFIGP